MCAGSQSGGGYFAPPAPPSRRKATPNAGHAAKTARIERAPQLKCGGHRFESCKRHHLLKGTSTRQPGTDRRKGLWPWVELGSHVGVWTGLSSATYA